jgi:hypothetical protein
MCDRRNIHKIPRRNNSFPTRQVGQGCWPFLRKRNPFHQASDSITVQRNVRARPGFAFGFRPNAGLLKPDLIGCSVVE